MFNPTAVTADAFGDHLSDTYLTYFSGRAPQHAAYLKGAARLVLERLANSDALYHNAEHTMMVTLVGQQILRGRLLTEALHPDDWLHFILALLVHDIGYSRGACPGDTDNSFVIDMEGNTITPPRGASDAFLSTYHVDRGIMYIRNRFGPSHTIDEERIVRAVDYTRFPVPDDPAYQDTESEPALVRAADLIGQMADPFYHRKINALFHEFEETGANEKLGYDNPMDLMEKYPDFFWSQVSPLIQPALGMLELTMEGKEWVAQLYNQVFQVERQTAFLGPFPGGD
ncbi:MAG: metal-dependent phosphohydrolase [Pseudomonadota bacterium]